MLAVYLLEGPGQALSTERINDRVLCRIEALALRLLRCYVRCATTCVRPRVNDYLVPLCCWTLANRFCVCPSVGLEHVSLAVLGNARHAVTIGRMEHDVLGVLLQTSVAPCMPDARHAVYDISV
jgi:hypothetical protein